MGDFVLGLFWRDGCEPTVVAMLDYAQAGLCGKVGLRVSPSHDYKSGAQLY